MYKSLTFTSQPIFIQFKPGMTVALKRTKGVGTFVLAVVVRKRNTFVIVYKSKDTRLNTLQFFRNIKLQHITYIQVA